MRLLLWAVVLRERVRMLQSSAHRQPVGNSAFPSCSFKESLHSSKMAGNIPGLFDLGPKQQWLHNCLWSAPSPRLSGCEKQPGFTKVFGKIILQIIVFIRFLVNYFIYLFVFNSLVCILKGIFYFNFYLPKNKSTITLIYHASNKLIWCYIHFLMVGEDRKSRGERGEQYGNMARDRLEPWFPMSSTAQYVLKATTHFCRSKAANVTISTFHETSCFPDAVLLLQFSLWPSEGAFCSVLACFASPFCVKLKMWSHISSPVLLCLGLCIDPRWDLVSTIDIWQLNDSLPRLLVSLPTSERSVVTWLRQDPINKCVADVSHFKQYLPVDYQKMALDGISHRSEHFFSCWSVGFMS